MTDNPGAMTLTEQLVCALRATVKNNGWSLNQFARETDLSVSTIGDFWRDNWNPTLSTLRKCEKILPTETEETTNGGAQKGKRRHRPRAEGGPVPRG